MSRKAELRQGYLLTGFLLVPCLALAQSPLQWVTHNRYIEVATGAHLQNYREQDTSGLTVDGTLNTETGTQNQIGTALRWQTALGWLGQLQAQRQSGVTDYSGYLQTGTGTLTPYQARTGNTASQYSMFVGYALNADNWSAMQPNWQLTPILQLGQHHWQRNLVQYSETYTFNVYAAGATLQWQPRTGTVMEAQALSGRTHAASVTVPTLGFASEQQGGSYRALQLGISQDMGALTSKELLRDWRVAARYSASQYDHGASPVVNTLQAPPNQQRPISWTLALQKQF